MFLGHLAVAFGTKRLAPRLSLGTLILGSQLADLLWPTFVVLGIERVTIVPGITRVTPLDFVSYPWSHSLLMLAIWGALAGAIRVGVRGGGRREGLVLATVVVSHWLLDFVVHRPDLTIVPGMPFRAGLGLWDSVPATLVLELVPFAVAVEIYRRTTRPRDRTGSWALAGFVVLLTVIFLGNVFGPPPPSVTAIAWVGHAIWLLVAWGWWIDRHRVVAG